MMSLVRAQLGEPQQSSLLTALFSFLSKFTAKLGEKVSVKKTVLWTVFSELGLSECCLRTNRSKRGGCFPPLQSKLGEPENNSFLPVVFSEIFLLNVKCLRRELIYFISLSALAENFTILYVLFYRLREQTISRNS